MVSLRRARTPSVYAPLGAYLRGAAADEVGLTFGQVEAILGRRLPRSARTDRSWWANQTGGREQARAWLNAGWRVGSCSLREEMVTFARG